MFDFLSFKNQVTGVRRQMDDLCNQVKNKQAELVHLRTSPPQKADVIAHFEAVINRLAARHDAALKFSIDRLSGDPLNFENTHGIGILTATQPHAAPSLQSVEVALLALFREDVKASLRKRVEAMPWAADTGPRIAERPALIEKVERDLAALDKDLAELRHQAAEGGVLI